MAARPRPLRQRLVKSLGPLRPPLKALHDAIFVTALPRIAALRLRRAGEQGEALARAARGISGRDLDAVEAEWVQRIEALRARLAASEETFEVSRLHMPPDSPKRRVTHHRLATLAGIHRPWGTFLLKLVRELKPTSCLELGTAAGISAAYQAAGLELNGAGRLVSIEGSPELAALATENLSDLGLSRVEVRPAAIEGALDEIATALAPIDLAYLDAGKSRHALLRQLDSLLPRLAPGAIVVIDDIHWSRELAGAWRAIRRDSRFELATDLWRVGLLRRPATDSYSAYGSKSDLRAPQTGQNQSSGMSSKAVPGGTPPSGSPSSGS